MKRIRRFRILGSTALGLAVLSVSTVSIAQFDVDLSGRVDFLVKEQQTFEDSITVSATAPITSFTSAGLPTATFADEAALQAAITAAGGTSTTTREKAGSNIDADINGRLDFRMSSQAATLDYGTFVRLDIDPEANPAFEVDAHAYISGTFGKLKFGNDIDGLQSAFDTSHISAGPLSPGKTVAFGGAFGTDDSNEASLVFQSPALLGVRLDAEIDQESDWTASASYRNSIAEGDFELVIGGDSHGGVGGYARGDYGDFTVLGFYMTDGDKEQASGAGMAFHAGPVTLSLDASIARTNELVGLGLNGIAGVTSINVLSADDHEETDVVFGAAYSISHGMELSGSVGVTENERSGQAVNAKGRLRIKF